MKKYFSFNLYKDGICQLKIPVIAFLIISLCYQLLFFGENSSIQLTMISICGVNGTMALSFLVLTPIMTFVLFRFLCKRNTSDFYHSIPHTRTSIVISFSAAIMSMVALFIIVNAICTSIIYTFFLDLYVISYKISLLEMLNLFVTSFLIMSILITAFSLGGTIFNNLIIAGVVLIGPMALIESMIDTILSSVCTATSDYVFGIFNIKNHTIPTMLFLYDDNLYNNTTRILTGLVIGILCFIVAVIFFNKRNSESAASFTYIKPVRLFLNVCLTFVACIYPANVVFQKIIGYGEEQHLSPLALIKWYLIALMVCILFEFVLTKTLKNLKVFIPILISVLVLNVAYIGALILEYNKHINFTPEADEIKYVRILDDSNSYTTNYLEYITSEIKYDDPEFNKLVSDKLKHYSKHPSLSDSYSSSDVNVTLVICVDGKEYYRDVVFDTEEQINIYRKLIKENYKRMDVYRHLPDYSDCVLDSYRVSLQLVDKNAEIIYNTLKEELKSFSDEELMTYHTEPSLFNSIYVFTTYDNKITYFNLNLNEHVPKTLNKWFEVNQAKNEQIYSEINTAFKNGKINKITITNYDQYVSIEKENFQHALEMINTYGEAKVNVEQGYKLYECIVTIDSGNLEPKRLYYCFTSNSQEFFDFFDAFNSSLPR